MVQTDPKPETRESQDTHTSSSQDVAERPQPAPDIRLAGEMQDGAYEQQQWLVQRDGQFVQLTELLYRVLEQVDGQRTLEEIAGGVSDAIDRRVSADNVRQLVSNKLVPLGLVAGADGTVIRPEPADGAQASRSPLQINMRVRALSPRLINPFTAVLQKLFWPPILIAMLLVAGAAQFYVFVIHGVASSVHDVLYHPALMFVLLGIIIVGTIWHEFGHASALRYGGGEVRGMGVGIYLVYPAFYTDVTDNYRLPRWSKVRTDLGGFYFNLIWCAGAVGVYLVTHVPWLLLIVVLIDLEIIQQTLPFGRYDGYWTLADITGIPDFFSRIPGFVRYMVPLIRTDDDEASRYKLWVRVVFALYIIVAAPVMGFIFFMLIKNVPRVLATGWDSAHKQLDMLNLAHSHGDGMGMVLAALQLLVLALPTLGMIYILFNLVRRGGKALWNYSKPSPGRRIKGGAIALGIAALLGYLWAPQLPFGSGRPGPWYSQTAWTPIGPNERGTIGDAGNSLAQVPVSYNPFHRQAPAGVTANTKGTVLPAKSRATAAAARASSTPHPRSTATAQAGSASNPGAGTNPGSASTPGVAVTATAPVAIGQATLTPAPTQPAGAVQGAPPAPPTTVPTAIATVQPTAAP